ncbi:PLP-dependent aminotransferase family protein [Pedobacter sp.]|uniref:aminotransferase-like domain-containing protein n=1 Tax=Pedobacter sp. TaxID=1411316 RepID=UPI003C393052
MEQAYEETTPQENKIKVSDILIDDGRPDPSLSPLKDIQRVYGEEDRNLMPRRLLPSRPEGGSPAMKSATARFLNDSRALNISTREILITRGGRMPLYLAASVLIATGEAVALSSHSDALTTEIFEHAGAEILRLRADENGIDPDHLKEFLAQGTIKALYIVPHCQYPTTSVLSSERRMKLLELMNQYNFWIIEDDFGYDFHYKNSPILPIASAAHNGKLIYIGNFDRIVSSALRIGFLVAPPEIIRQGVILQRLIDQHGDIHLEQMLLKMMDNGGIERHIMRSKKIYAQRCELFCNMLQEKLGHIITFERPRAGLSVYIRFEDSFSMNRLITGCSRMGLYFSGETYQDCKNGTENRMVFGFAALRLKELEQAVDIMVKVIAEIYPASRMFRVNKMSISAISA